jgi:hypothetical protein
VIPHTKTCDYNSSRRFVIASVIESRQIHARLSRQEKPGWNFSSIATTLANATTLDSRTFYRNPIHLAGLLFTRMEGAIGIVVDLHQCILATAVFPDSGKRIIVFARSKA